MVIIIVLSLVYLLGYIICYSMMRVEHEAEGNVYTKGDRLLNITLSIFSFLWILFLLISAWVRQIRKTGYWSRPVKQVKPETE